MRQTMGRIGLRTGFLVSLLLAFALLFSNMVHAAEQMCEPAGIAAIEQGGGGHAKGDSGALHQHGGCHGHHLAAPAFTAEVAGHFAAASPKVAAPAVNLAEAPPGSS